MSFDMDMEDYKEDILLSKERKKCIVTGGAGFIGSHLVDRLIDDGHEVHILDDLSTGKRENVNDKAKLHHFDLSDLTRCEIQYGWKQTWKEVDIVFHMAAKARVQPSIDDPIDFNQVNVNGTLNVLKTAVDYGVKRFVFSSSSSVYGDVKEKDLLPCGIREESELNPMSPYALQKLIGEQYCKLFSKLYGLSTVCLRYFNVYGDRMTLDGAYNRELRECFNWEPTMKIEDWIKTYKEKMGL